MVSPPYLIANHQFLTKSLNQQKKEMLNQTNKTSNENSHRKTNLPQAHEREKVDKNQHLKA